MTVLTSRLRLGFLTGLLAVAITMPVQNSSAATPAELEGRR